MAGIADPTALGQMPLFRQLLPVELSTINLLLHRITFPAGATIMTVEQPGEVVYIILNGTVKVHVEQANGSDVIVGLRGAGEIVGEMSMVESDADVQVGRSANVVALEQSTLLWMDRGAFLHALETVPRLALNLTRILARRLRLATLQIQVLATQDVYGRVACQLLAFAQQYGNASTAKDVVIPLRLTQSDLASLVGASRVRVNQVLVDYKERGHISVSPQHYITIHNASALARRCQ